MRRASIGDRGWGALLVVFATACWASLGILGKLAFAQGIGPQTLVAVRAGLAVTIAVAVMSIANRRVLRPPRRSLMLFVLLGLAASANYSLFFQSVVRLSVGASISIFYLYPVLVTIIARFALHEQFTPTKWAALFVAVIGCVLVSGAWQDAAGFSLVGGLYAFGAAFSNAAYTVLMKFALREHPPARIIVFSLLFALPVLFVLALLSGEQTPSFTSLSLWWLIILLAIFPTLSGYYLFAMAMRRIEASRASIIGTLEPLLATLIAFVVLNERLLPLQLLGMLCIIVGAALAQWRRVASPIEDS